MLQKFCLNLLLVNPNPSQSREFVAIDMGLVHDCDRVMTRTTTFQFWLSVFWMTWAWVCASARAAYRWCRNGAGTFRWLVPTRVTLYLVPFLVTQEYAKTEQM